MNSKKRKIEKKVHGIKSDKINKLFNKLIHDVIFISEVDPSRAKPEENDDGTTCRFSWQSTGSHNPVREAEIMTVLRNVNGKEYLSRLDLFQDFLDIIITTEKRWWMLVETYYTTKDKVQKMETHLLELGRCLLKSDELNDAFKAVRLKHAEEMKPTDIIDKVMYKTAVFHGQTDSEIEALETMLREQK